jgi:hypothetical protein
MGPCALPVVKLGLKGLDHQQVVAVSLQAIDRIGTAVQEVDTSRQYPLQFLSKEDELVTNSTVHQVKANPPHIRPMTHRTAWPRGTGTTDRHAG